MAATTYEDRTAPLRPPYMGERLVALVLAAGAVVALRLMRPASGVLRVVYIGGQAVTDARSFLRRKMVRSAFTAGALIWLTGAAACMLAEGSGVDNGVTAYAGTL